MLPTGREEGELSVTETGEASQRPSDGVLISLHGSERQKEREKTFVNKEFRAKPPKEDEPGERPWQEGEKKERRYPCVCFLLIRLDFLSFAPCSSSNAPSFCPAFTQSYFSY